MDITSANRKLTEMYKEIQPIVESVVNKQSKEIDSIINKIKKDLTTMTNKELQNYMLQLSIETYYFSHIKDMSVLKQECALALAKEAQANIFNGTVGTQAVRNNQSIIDTLDKQTVNMLYAAVANNLRSKLDEAHRIVNVLSNVLISKNAEAKLKGVKDEGNLYGDSVSEYKA